jgi:regulator of protease activity HflC (stomatin/prohibitin superfamily)
MKTYGGSVGAIVFDIIVAAVIGFAFGAGNLENILVIGIVAFLVLLALSIRIISQWNRMPVLRLGRYNGIIGPGFITIIPFIEATPSSLDLRVINTTFSAEQTLTKDNVPVNVDAILFWQILDPEKAVLNVQSYFNSVQLASQTAMRDVIGKSTLSEMLAGRDMIGKDIDELIQDRVGDWGIKAISVEIRDVKIPQALQDAMARVATAEREKMARVTLAESETLAADKMIDAAKKYEKNPYAMQLRSLNMMYEVSINGRNQIIFIPTESRGFSLPTPIGLLGIDDIAKQAKMRKQPVDKEKGS